MPRMTNTYMLAGGSDPNEIIASVKNGIYATYFGGGQVDITSGKYVFQCYATLALLVITIPQSLVNWLSDMNSNLGADSSNTAAGPMRRFKWLIVGLLVLAAPPLAGAATYVLGDSIGDGVATTLGLNNLAQIGIHIRGPKALAQIARTPPGSTVFVFLGTNDAEGSIKNIDNSIDDILAAAERRQLSLIWIGPHCVRKSWDSSARKLDDILRTHLAETSAKYVSTRDPAICSGKFHEPDGVHLTMKGYRYLWAMIQNDVDVPATALASTAPRQRGVDGDAGVTTGSLGPAFAASRQTQSRATDAPDAGIGHRLVMEIHIPGSPSEPLVWTRSQN
jgi:hypothetical protein